MTITYYTYDEVAKRLVPADAVLHVLRDHKRCTIVHPSADDYAALNPPAYPRGEDNPPVPEEGYTVIVDGFELSNGKWVRKYRMEPIPLPSLGEYDSAMESFLRQEREERGYTTREPDSYLTSSVARWRVDAEDWVRHRDEVMEYAIGVMNAVQSGQMQQPTMEEFMDGLPKITWSYTD